MAFNKKQEMEDTWDKKTRATTSSGFSRVRKTVLAAFATMVGDEVLLLTSGDGFDAKFWI